MKLDEIQSKVIEIALDETNNHFKAPQNDLVPARLEYVTNTQHVTEGGEYKDGIDAVVGMRRQMELVKVCEACEAPNDPSYRLCRNCRCSRACGLVGGGLFVRILGVLQFRFSFYFCFIFVVSFFYY